MHIPEVLSHKADLGLFHSSDENKFCEAIHRNQQLDVTPLPARERFQMVDVHNLEWLYLLWNRTQEPFLRLGLSFVVETMDATVDVSLLSVLN